MVRKSKKKDVPENDYVIETMFPGIEDFIPGRLYRHNGSIFTAEEMLVLRENGAFGVSVTKNTSNVEVEDNSEDIVEEQYDDKGRYSNFIVRFINTQYPIDIDFCGSITEKTFDRYKVGFIKSPECVCIIGNCKIRKRLSSIVRLLENNFKKAVSNKEIDEDVASYYRFTLNVNQKPFDKSVPEGEFVFGDGSEMSYSGEDVSILDAKSQRFDWQNKLLDKILDVDKREFLVPNDRTIIWIYDPKGCTGKSKFVKWVCVNYSEEVEKITFGTTGQLKSSLISAGIRKCYFLDMPRTTGKEDNLESMISAIEDLKNGHLVSNFYGRHKKLIMNPPHIVVFSNQKCPKHMMSSDRWLTFEIKNNDLKKI